MKGRTKDEDGTNTQKDSEYCDGGLYDGIDSLCHIWLEDRIIYGPPANEPDGTGKRDMESAFLCYDPDGAGGDTDHSGRDLMRGGGVDIRSLVWTSV